MRTMKNRIAGSLLGSALFLLASIAAAEVAIITHPGTQEIGLSKDKVALVLKGELDAIKYRQAEAALRYSIAGRIGTGLEFVSRWAGFDWRTNIALVGGFAAKEVVVSTLGTAYSLGEVDPQESGTLSAALAKDPGWSPLAALSLIVFTMFYSPCFVSVVCISRESGTWKWGAFAIAFNTLLAFMLSVLIYQVGSALSIAV